MIDPTEIAAIGGLQPTELVDMNTTVDKMFFSPWKLNAAQRMAWEGDKNKRVSISLGGLQ